MWMSSQNKKNYPYIDYFQSCFIISLQNNHTIQYTSGNAAPVFEIRPSCFVTQTCLPQFSNFELSYPATYCTQINTLHLTQHLTSLTSTHFTLPSILLHSHQHTSPYPASYCTHINTLHLTQHLTVLTSTH